MSGIVVVLAVAGWVLFGMTLLALVVRPGRTERADRPDASTMDREVSSKGIDFDRDQEARRRFLEDAP